MRRIGKGWYNQDRNEEERQVGNEEERQGGSEEERQNRSEEERQDRNGEERRADGPGVRREKPFLWRKAVR